MGAQSFIAPASALDRRTLGKFEVLCRLSTGGMSEIYLAHQRGVGGFRKLVVIKTILPDIGGEEDFVRMFLDEARTTAAFAHPNIAQVYELDVDDGNLFMAMEFVQGCTLVEMARACRQAKEPIPIGFTIAAVRDTALALHYAHTFVDARGRKQMVIHRDVAEKNIMVTYEGVTKLLDFGIAKAQGQARSNRTGVGMVKGTSGYMSPEQIRGEPLDGRSDIFSLGVVLHECLTGMRLFHGKNPEESMLAALNQNVAPPSRLNPRVWPELDAIVIKALSRNRDERYATALELARSLDKVGRDEVWNPEQSGELVVRHFTERRNETSRLLQPMFGESTGEIRIDSLLAKVRAGAQSNPELKKNLPHPPATPPSKAPSMATPSEKRAMGGDIATNPARGRLGVSPTPTPPIPPPKPLLQDPPTPAPAPARSRPQEDFSEDSDAKTIPASSMSDELKLLRSKYKSQRAEAAGAGVVPAHPKDAIDLTPARGSSLRDRPQSATASTAPSIVVDESITSDIHVGKPANSKRATYDSTPSLVTKPAVSRPVVPLVTQEPPPPPSATIDPNAFNDDGNDANTVMATQDELRAMIPNDVKRILDAQRAERAATVDDPKKNLTADAGADEDDALNTLERINTGENTAAQPRQGGNGLMLVLIGVGTVVVLTLAALIWLRLGPFAGD